ncbi:MAG: hypothetical protein ACK5KU_11905 [Beutenbergiaceae bacterium]
MADNSELEFDDDRGNTWSISSPWESPGEVPTGAVDVATAIYTSDDAGDITIVATAYEDEPAAMAAADELAESRTMGEPVEENVFNDGSGTLRVYEDTNNVVWFYLSSNETTGFQYWISGAEAADLVSFYKELPY